MSTTIESHAQEKRVFPPPPDFAARSHLGSRADYEQQYRRSLADPESFWREQAAEYHWFEPPQRILRWEPPHAKWFEGGKTNLSFNCLDRHLNGPRRHKAALVWEGEPGEVRTLTYQQLHRETCRFASVLKKLGVAAGDRVAIYMGMVPEAAVAMLACARIGAVHSVIFGGFAAEAVRDRVNDQHAKVIVTQDGGYRRGAIVALKDFVDRALPNTPSVEHVVVLKRAGNPCEMKEGRDHWWHELDAKVPATPLREATPLDAEHPLFILYTSGTTGKPKGIVHS